VGSIVFRDAKGDVAHRDYKGYGGLHYSDSSGRNDIITSKVSVDVKNISFYVETDKPLTPHTGDNWMLLLIDADNNPATGWHGYDFIINKKIISDKKSTLMRYNSKNSKNPWQGVAKIDYRYKDNKLEISIPRNLVGLTSNRFFFRF